MPSAVLTSELTPAPSQPPLPRPRSFFPPDGSPLSTPAPNSVTSGTDDLTTDGEPAIGRGTISPRLCSESWGIGGVLCSYLTGRCVRHRRSRVHLAGPSHSRWFVYRVGESRGLFRYRCCRRPTSLTRALMYVRYFRSRHLHATFFFCQSILPRRLLWATIPLRLLRATPSRQHQRLPMS